MKGALDELARSRNCDVLDTSKATIGLCSFPALEMRRHSHKEDEANDRHNDDDSANYIWQSIFNFVTHIGQYGATPDEEGKTQDAYLHAKHLGLMSSQFHQFC